MKYQNLFSWKNKKTISKCCLLKILPSVLSLKCTGEFAFPLSTQSLIGLQINGVGGVGGAHRRVRMSQCGSNSLVLAVSIRAGREITLSILFMSKILLPRYKLFPFTRDLICKKINRTSRIQIVFLVKNGGNSTKCS